ncbi:uncharacterized protein IL334_001776 [Kwoniella shivajii]|uniref:Homeobox domain-containing protein n=1 Tax=Kwoniella shivajii TaxID=564305 RepID=A0ABZ1CSU8_9TREE|nr:hypothetical protein IL334_001776 [Kwoniella shivajii]
MSVPQPQGYIENQRFLGQNQGPPPHAGPSNYVRQQPIQQQQQPPHPDAQSQNHNQSQIQSQNETLYYGMSNGHIQNGYPAQIGQMPLQPQQQQQHLQQQHQQHQQHQQQQQQQFMTSYQPQVMSHGHIQQGIPYPGFEMNSVGIVPTPNLHFGSIPQNGPWMDEWADGHHSSEGQDMVYSNLEVKHRRRTTPDQLKILEYWYDINPKPDNALREHLAAQLGMTKRNVQVWFQNRRAKMKGLAKKDDKGGDEEDQNTPENDTVISPIEQTQSSQQYQQHIQQQQQQQRQMLLPAMGAPPMARRASLANGEAAKIEMFVAKRAAAASGQKQGLRPPGFVSPQRSPLMGTASAARRQSIPYPTPISAGPGPGQSPKFSPVVRVMPSALHLTAMRNNTRRASMPGAAQLISSGPFTPPRVVTNQHQVGNPRGDRGLSTIKDDDSTIEQVFYDQDTDFSTTYITPPSSTYDPSSMSPISFLPTDSTGYDQSIPFSPNSPLPNPSFSFGGDGHQIPVLDEAEAARQQQLFFAFQQRGRMGSIASINTYTTDNGNGTDVDDSTLGDWITSEAITGAGQQVEGQEGPDGFDPDARRASAPADLLHQIGIMGLNGIPTPIRPSPLGSHFTPDNYHLEPFEGTSVPMTMNSSDLDPSPMSNSIPSSQSVSPTENHQFQQIQNNQQQSLPHHPVRSISLQQFPNSNSNSNPNITSNSNSQSTPQGMDHSSSVSPYSDHSAPPGYPQSYGQQSYQNAIFEGYQPPQNGIAHPSNHNQNQNIHQQ